MKDEIVKIVTDHYLNSHDFNGIQIWNLLSSLGKEWQVIKNEISELIKDEKIRIIDERTDVNPNIIRTGFESIESQVKKTMADDPGYMCLYPSPSVLKKAVKKNKYAKEPYKLRQALGEAQLAFATFDLSVLEFYRNDPRYRYENDDISGQIYYRDEGLQESDKTFLQTFGFAYNEEFNRAVAVFLTYLADMTPEHQQIWKAKEISSGYKLHPDYYKNSIIGDWGDRVPILQAFLKELDVINQMSAAMGRPLLFHQTYGEYGEKRPKKLHFLIRPTLEEFNNFIHLFDKMISENINKDFFQNEIKYEKEEQRGDGKIIVTQKGTLQLLDEWVRKSIKLNDWSEWSKAIAALRHVRELRQKPAHAVQEDEFDQKYYKEQRKIILETYKSIRLIRLLFANHPKVKSANIDIPDWLFGGKIWHM